MDFDVPHLSSPEPIIDSGANQDFDKLPMTPATEQDSESSANLDFDEMETAPQGTVVLYYQQ